MPLASTQKPVHVGLSISPSEDFRIASLPLFEAGEVDAIEWNMDLGWSAQGTPVWVRALLDAYGEAGRLHGHGVEFSLFSTPISERQERWLGHFAREVKTRSYVRISEHFGFISGGAFINGTVMPHPRSEAALRVGADRLKRLSELASMPVGLENLALAFSPRDVEEQPDFIDALLESNDGFLLLDLHNLFCQASNFGVDAHALLRRYPLHRVRELHLAGGELSYPASDPERRAFRRDSHVGFVPEEVFALLGEAIAQCPKLEAIFVEKSDHTLSRAAEMAQHVADFRRVRALVQTLGRGEVAP
jgi:uncharacterized protein (UPF0276 family)